MALKISQDPITFWQPVKGKMPNERGSFDDFSFKARFKLMDLDEIDRITADDKFIRSLMREALLDWSGVEDADSKEAIPFNEEMREAVLRVSVYNAALWEAYMRGVNGGAKAKN